MFFFFQLISKAAGNKPISRCLRNSRMKDCFCMSASLIPTMSKPFIESTSSNKLSSHLKP